MKKVKLILAGALQGTLTFVAPGLYKYTPQGGGAGNLIVLNQTPVQNMNDWGGWNIVDPNATSSPSTFPTGVSVSVQQYLNRATEFAQTPPLGCLVNYRTAEMAAQAIEDGTNIQGIVFGDI